MNRTTAFLIEVLIIMIFYTSLKHVSTFLPEETFMIGWIGGALVLLILEQTRKILDKKELEK